MNPIVEELFTALIKRIEALEFWKASVERIEKSPYAPSKQGPAAKTGARLASQNQIDYLTKLGGQAWEGITHEEISPMIDELKKAKDEREKDSVNEGHKKIIEKAFKEEEKEEFPDY